MRLPHVMTTEDVDLAIVGVPTDDAVSFRSGARFGPEAVRSASVLLRPYNPHLEIDVVETLSMVDYGDAPTVPGYHEESLARIEEYLAPLHEAGVTPLCIGGDHSIVLAELRAAAKVHGPLALVHLDAHADVWEDYYGARYFHGTVFKRAVEEGLVDPSRSVQAGMRGTLYGASDVHASADLGYDALTWTELEALTPREYGDRVRARVGDGPAFLSLRHRLRRPGVRAGDGDAGGRRADQQRGARVPARADRDRLPRLRLRGGLSVLRPGADHRVAGGERLPRDDLAGRAATGMTGGEAVVRALAEHGVELVFGIPGTHTLELHRHLTANGIRHVTPRHEAGGGYAADGYARVTGQARRRPVHQRPGRDQRRDGGGDRLRRLRPAADPLPVDADHVEGRDTGFLHEGKDQGAAMDALVAWSRTRDRPRRRGRGDPRRVRALRVQPPPPRPRPDPRRRALQRGQTPLSRAARPQANAARRERQSRGQTPLRLVEGCSPVRSGRWWSPAAARVGRTWPRSASR